MRYGYIRVSTYGQAKNGNSLQDQRDKLMANGILQENIFVDKYTGTKIDRPGFDRLLGLLQPGDELVVCKLDRFARTAADGSKLVRKLVDDGIIVNILNMGRADNTPTGKLMVTILLAFAEYERDMIVERTSEGREYARENKPGFREGRPPKEYPDFENFLKMKKDGLMTVKEGCERLGISRSQWYALERKKGAEHSPSDQRLAMPR